MVGRVVVLLVLLTGDDAARTARGGARGDHGVLVIVARGLTGQDAFPVLEDGAVLRVRVGAALLNQVEGVVRLGGQVAVADAADRGGRRGGSDGAADEEGGQNGGCGADAGDSWGNLMPS